MSLSADEFASVPRSRLTDVQLFAQLRRASNHLEMIAAPNSTHHADDPERLRVAALSLDDREKLRQVSIRTVAEVRAEFRRRGG